MASEPQTGERSDRGTARGVRARATSTRVAVMAATGEDSGLTVGDAMTPGPHCIGAGQSIALAEERMAEWRVRHLPVLEGGQLVGVLSERDIAFVRDIMPGKAQVMSVEEAMSAVPYCVERSVPLAEVARHMASRRLGSAIVMDHGRVAGVFTTTDALHTLAELLERSSAASHRPFRAEAVDRASKR